MTSELRVDRIVPVDGVPTGGGGGIVQIKSTHITAAFTTQSETYTDITGHSVTITPKFNTSKILIDYRVSWMHTSSNGASATLRLLRNGTNIGVPVATDDRMGILLLSLGSTQNMSNSSINYLDSPATTSALTYKIQIHLDSAGGSGGHIFGINHYPPNDNYRSTSSITAYEVSA
jgi:hypothetical protein